MLASTLALHFGKSSNNIVIFDIMFNISAFMKICTENRIQTKEKWLETFKETVTSIAVFVDKLIQRKRS